MSEEVFGQFLGSGIILCVVMGVLLPILRWRKYGPAALPLGFAFFAMALLMHALNKGWPQDRIIGIAVVLVILLAGDALLRSNSDLKR